MEPETSHLKMCLGCGFEVLLVVLASIVGLLLVDVFPQTLISLKPSKTMLALEDNKLHRMDSGVQRLFVLRKQLARTLRDAKTLRWLPSWAPCRGILVRCQAMYWLDRWLCLWKDGRRERQPAIRFDPDGGIIAFYCAQLQLPPTCSRKQTAT